MRAAAARGSGGSTGAGSTCTGTGQHECGANSDLSRAAVAKVDRSKPWEIVVENVNDPIFHSVPAAVQPAVISVEEVQQPRISVRGDTGDRHRARVDKERGQAIVSATRQPNTAGVSGTGTIMGIVVKAIARALRTCPSCK